MVKVDPSNGAVQTDQRKTGMFDTSVEEITVSWIVLGPSDSGCLLREPQLQRLPAGTTVMQALQRVTGLNATEVAGLFSGKRVAIFGMTALPGDRLHAGDRIEVLDDLRFDPMDSRRRRAEHKARQPRSRRRVAKALD